MYNLSLIEECYTQYIRKLPHLLPEGIAKVNLQLLSDFHLLDHFFSEKALSESFTRFFHVVETPEKVTLVNDEFIIWIVPERQEKSQSTNVLIALNRKNIPEMEVAFSADGVYNNSGLILAILEKFLEEIQENEEILKQYRSAS